jgi:hypothetical protein
MLGVGSMFSSKVDRINEAITQRKLINQVNRDIRKYKVEFVNGAEKRKPGRPPKHKEEPKGNHRRVVIKWDEDDQLI